MFSIEEIKKSESKIQSGADFPKFIAEIKALGVTRSDVYVSTGLSMYFDDDDHSQQVSPDEYLSLVINDEPSVEKLQHALSVHQNGETDFATFCKQAADAGVEKWVIDLEEMTCTYLDSEGHELVKENILQV